MIRLVTLLPTLPVKPKVAELAKPTQADTKAKIQEYLKAKGIDYPTTATKDELLNIVNDRGA